MRGLTLLIATTLTFGYGFAAQAAMTVDRAETFRRVARAVETADATVDPSHIWYGGMLAPVTVEATAQPKCILS
ncbi:MAG TPA: hypothetical protein VN803_05095 [Gemmatimonadales bacterium]|nr:hypothetical protein [Gemmatimonadales bacterium]